MGSSKKDSDSQLSLGLPTSDQASQVVTSNEVQSSSNSNNHPSKVVDLGNARTGRVRDQIIQRLNRSGIFSS